LLGGIERPGAGPLLPLGRRALAQVAPHAVTRDTHLDGDSLGAPAFSGRPRRGLQQPLQDSVALEEMPAGYPEWLADVKARVRRAQPGAAQAANGEFLMFNLDLGRDIPEKMILEGYGTKVVDRLSHDLKVEGGRNIGAVLDSWHQTGRHAG
jgi:hypothetical protein